MKPYKRKHNCYLYCYAKDGRDDRLVVFPVWYSTVSS